VTAGVFFGIHFSVKKVIHAEIFFAIMLFSGWESLLRTLIVWMLAYVSLIVFLRISGKRTLSQMNAFDLAVTVSLGSTDVGSTQFDGYSPD
jgi:hypothetical protein